MEHQGAKRLDNTMLGFTGFRWVRGVRVDLLSVSRDE